MSTPTYDWTQLGPEATDFLTERHLATLTTLRADGTPHTVPVGVTIDPEHDCAWVITGGGSAKARHLRARPDSPVSVCQVDGARWATIEGTAEVRDDEASVARAVERYAARYRQPRENPERVALRITVSRILLGARLR